jgi:hypothetical protein
MELDVLSKTTMDLVGIYDALSREVDALKEMGDFGEEVNIGGMLLIKNIQRREEELEGFTLNHVLRSSLLDGIAYFDELLCARVGEE